MTDEQFAEFFQSYIECAFWSSTDENDAPLDALYFSCDLALGCRNAMRADCAAFVRDCANDLAGLDPGQCGHDFWLTRNGHGVGFCDRGLGALGERLSKAARPYGSVDLYVNDDGKVDV